MQGEGDNEGDVNVTDEESDAEGGRKKDVNGILVEVVDLRHNIGLLACCLIRNRALRSLIDTNDEVTRLPSILIGLLSAFLKTKRCRTHVYQWRTQDFIF